MLCQVPWGVVQGGDLDPSDPEAANPGLCLQTLMTENSGLNNPIHISIMKLILFITYYPPKSDVMPI
jgi:hypothetical protein